MLSWSSDEEINGGTVSMCVEKTSSGFCAVNRRNDIESFMRHRHFVRGVTHVGEHFVQLRAHGAFIAGDGFNVDEPAG